MKFGIRFWNIFACTVFSLLLLGSVTYVMVQDVRSEEPQAGSRVLLVDDFEGEEIVNTLGSRSNIYVQGPSRIMMSRYAEKRSGVPTNVLMLRYDKKGEGGPHGSGGWCGYYTLLKDMKSDTYLDGSSLKKITFWVRGEKGGENFTVGLADRHWDKVGDSMKSEEIGKYLPSGRLTAEWQKAVVPLDVYFLDYSKLSSISLNFEGSLYPEGVGSGTVFVDDIALE